VLGHQARRERGFAPTAAGAYAQDRRLSHAE